MTRKETIAEGIDLYLGDCRDIAPLRLSDATKQTDMVNLAEAAE